jgi:hypothetical protein
VSDVRPEVIRALADLLEAASQGPLDIDRFATIVGVSALDGDEIDGLFADLEARGHVVTAPEGGATGRLKQVLGAARELRTQLGRTPRAAEIAAHAGLTEADVHIALSFSRTLGKPR